MQKEVLKEKLGDTLNRRREICRSHEGSTKTHDMMQNKEIRQVSKKEERCGGQAGGKKKSSYKQGKTAGGSSTSGGAGQGGGPGKEPQGGAKTITDCSNCGRTHRREHAWRRDWSAGSVRTRIGHFASVRRSEPTKQNNVVFLVNLVEREEPMLKLETIINGKERTMTRLIDTGAQVPLLGPEDVQLFRKVKPKSSKNRLVMADNSKLDVMGQVDVTMHLGETAHEMQVLVVRGLEWPTLDFRSLVALGLIEEGWPKVRNKDKDPISQLTDEELEGNEELVETVKEFSVRTVQVVDRAEEQMDNKALRGYKNLSWKDRRARISSWKDWCSVSMQKRARLKSEADMYYPSKEDGNPKRTPARGAAVVDPG